MNDLYIYYQVAEGDAPALLPLIIAMQARLAAASPVRPQLKRRPGSRDGLQTWMEVYPAAPAGFAAALASAVTEAGLAARIQGARHSEEFMDLIPCV